VNKVGVLPCSGSCNVGMLTNKAVVEMCGRRDNVGFVCALGLPLGIESIIANARKFDKNVAANGCEVRCSTKSLEKAGLAVDEEIVVTRDLGIQKTKNLNDDSGLEVLKSKLDEIVDRLSQA